MNTITLNDGVKIPQVGFGTYQIPPGKATEEAVAYALSCGCRHIDTATAYFNEADVGKAVRASGVKREDLFITSKLWLQDYGYEPAKKGIDASLRKLGTDYMDLYLIHQPYGDVPGAWKAMEEAQAAGKIRSIGVSNMTVKIWNAFVPQFDSMPSVNQIEYHPYQQQKAIRALMAEKQTALEAWAPLGQGWGGLLQEPLFADLASKYQKDVGQIVLRFEVQEGAIVFPKSVHPERIKSNLQVFDFELTDDEMAAIRALDKGAGMHDPDTPGFGEWLLTKYDVHADEK